MVRRFFSPSAIAALAQSLLLSGESRQTHTVRLPGKGPVAMQTFFVRILAAYPMDTDQTPASREINVRSGRGRKVRSMLSRNARNRASDRILSNRFSIRANNTPGSLAP